MKSLGLYLLLGSVGMVRPMGKTSATKLISKGNEHYRKGELGPAMSAYNRAIEMEPKNPIAWNNKGLILAVVGKYEQALECHQTALGLDERYIDAISNIGMIHSKMRNYDEAMKYYDMAIALKQNHETAWNNKGNLLSKMDRHEEAIDCYRRALKIAPRYVAAMNNMAVALSHLKKYEEAIDLIEDVLDKRPTFAEAWYIKGKAYIGMKQLKKAAVCFERAHRLNPEFDKAEKALRVLRDNLERGDGGDTKKRRPRKSKREVEKKVEADLAEVGVEMEKMEGEFDHMDEHLDEKQRMVFDRIGDDPVTKTSLKKELGGRITQKELESSLEILADKDLIGRDQKGRATYYSRSETLGPMEEEIIDLGDGATAGMGKKKAGARKTFDEHLADAKNLAKKNRHEDALKSFRKALKINPYDDMALLLRARSYYEVGKREKAVESVSRVLKGKPDFLPAWITLAEMSYKHKQWKDAFDCYSKILELQPDNQEAAKRLATAEKKMRAPQP